MKKLGSDANSFTTKANCYTLILPYQLPKVILDFQRIIQNKYDK